MIAFRLIRRSEMACIVPLLRMLDDSQDESVLQRRVESMVQDHGYVCVGAYDGDRLVGISGLWILTKYYVGKHIEADNVVIHPEYRGRGIGKEMMAWIYEYGRARGCEAAELNCYVGNTAGDRFWKQQGFRIIGYHYQKRLST